MKYVSPVSFCRRLDNDFMKYFVNKMFIDGFKNNGSLPKKRSAGYTLLFAVLTSAVVLGIGVFILGIARKQYILSSTARDSMYAFYAADSGIECVAANQGVLSTTSPGSLMCNGQTINVTYSPNNPNQNTYNLGSGPMSSIFGASINMPYYTEPSNPGASPMWGCAIVTLDEFTYAGLLYTVVQSRGYNLCELSAGKYVPANSPRTVERALQWVLK